MTQPRPAETGIVSQIFRRSRLARFCVLVLIACTVLLLLIGLLQRHLIYHPLRLQNLSARRIAVAGSVVNDVTVTTHDGLELNGWHFRQNGDFERPVAIVFPGNAGHRMVRLELSELLISAGCDVLLFDYRGYGDNPGKPSQSDLVRDAATIWKFARGELSYESDQILLYGESLGGGVAVQLAADCCQQGEAPAGLILQSTFNSLIAAGQHHFPLLPVSWMLLDPFRSDQRIGEVTCPILMLHGDRDRVVPHELGEQLIAEAAAESEQGIAARFVTLPGADHNDVLLVSKSLMRRTLREFVSRLGFDSHS